ncbi:MAG: N-hydroxyarylamine O-acetyltransferase [Chloroflexota bacterium]|jgi:N-hydroxyarylamine O-acetyltransferase|nr:N-hydroxyarylamine O-acetyltransferase [Chloroflexota bacterium]
MALQAETLGADTLERVVMKLGFTEQPAPTLAGLQAIYGAWCRRVPFDNVQKMVHLHEGRPGPLAGDDAESFFHNWLADGTGGTCWAGNGALHALLVTLGFAAVRGIGTMLTSPDVPPNHGTVLVDLDEARYVVDASILHGAPLRLDEHAVTKVVQPAWGVTCEQRDGRWHIHWRPLHRPEGIDCRIDQLQATRAAFHEAHERTRAWSPFNYQLSARLLRDDAVVGAAFGQRVTLNGTGGVDQAPLADADRIELLIEGLGMSEAIARRLPPERPTPPPPGSRTVLEQADL